MTLLARSLPVFALLAVAPAAIGQIGVNYCAANANSTGVISLISAAGSTDVALNDVTLACDSLPLNAFGYFITSQAQGFVAGPGGSSGNLCLGSNIGRYAGNVVSSGSTGSVSLMIDLTLVPAPAASYAVMPGDTVNFQFWHRDAVAGSVISNFSEGLEIQFDASPGGPTFSQDIWPMLTQPNINSGACNTCHGQFGFCGLNFPDVQSAYNNLINVPTNCCFPTAIYVTPGDPAASMFYEKLNLAMPSCGSAMPQGGTFAGDINTVRDWILAGAQF